MLPDICNSDTSTILSDGCGEFVPCCGSCTSDTVFAEIHPGSSVKELFRRKGTNLRYNSITYAQSRNRLKKSASRLAYQCKRRCHHQHQRTPLLYDLYVLNSEDTDTDTSGKTSKEPKDVEVRKTRSNDEPTEGTSQHSRRAMPLKKPSVLCVPRVCQLESSTIRHKYARPRNCRLCHHHYCSWMKEDFLNPRFAEKERKPTSEIPVGEPVNKTTASSLKESLHGTKHDNKKFYIENEFQCVASELNALLQKCEREIADKGASEQGSSKQDPPAASSSFQPRVPLSIQRKLKEQLKQATQESPGQHGNQSSALSVAESRGTQTRQPFNFNEHSLSQMRCDTNSEVQWFDNQQKSSQKFESSRVCDDERNSLVTEGTSEGESIYSTHDIVGSQVQQKQKASPRNSPQDRKEEREGIFTEHVAKLEKGILEKHLYDPKPYYEHELQFRRGSQGDGPISSSTSKAETVVHGKTSPKPRRSRCESLKNVPVLPYCMEPQNVFLATCNRQHSTNVEHPRQKVKDTPRSSHEEHNKWLDSNEFQHQQGDTASETLTVISVPLQTISADNSISASPKSTTQDPEALRSPTTQEEKPQKEKPVLSEKLEDLDTYLGRVTNEAKNQQESSEGRNPISESNATQENRSVRMSRNSRPFKSRSLTSVSLPNYHTQALDSEEYKPWTAPKGLYEERNDKEEERINSLHSSESRIASDIQTAVQREMWAFSDRSSDARQEAQDEPSLEAATVKANSVDRIGEAKAEEQNIQTQNVVNDSTSYTVNESFSDWPDIYKMGVENHAMYKKLINFLPGEEADYIRKLRKQQWNHLSRIKQEIQSLEQLVRFLDSYGSDHVLYSTQSAPT